MSPATARGPARGPQRDPARRPLVLAVAAACLSLGASAAVRAQGQALPAGLQVVRGSAGVSVQGGAMTVTNSANAILNWQSFSVGSGHGVHFQQPGEGSQVLNRVLGSDPSAILGSLTSNGRVWLLNPNGVVFGRDARVDVAGLVASTLNVSDSDWLAGRYRLEAGPGLAGAGVSNLGDIRTPAGGRVLLLSDGEVRNEGRIDAAGGQVALVSARRVTLVDSARPHIGLRVDAPSGEVLNSGQLQAAGGRVDLQGAMVNQQGLVSADAIGRGPGGEVLLQASGDTLVSGTVSARSEGGQGGDVRLLGRHVGLVDGARVDASGATGGGQVLVGGGLQGRDPTVPNAEAAFIGADASIAADATQAGDGGRIIVWSDHATRVYGTLLARGGPLGGDGGFIETSGGWLDASPRQVSAAAPAGQAGQWLLDPNNILISDSVADTSITGSPDFTSTSDDARISSASIVNAMNAGNDVTVTSGSGAPNTQFGDIVVDGATLVHFANTSTVTLTFNAARQLLFNNSTLGANFGGRLNVVMNAGIVVQLTQTTVDTRGGNVNIDGGTATVGLINSAINTSGGNVRIVTPNLSAQDGGINSGTGRMDIRTDALQLTTNGVLASTAAGDALVIQGATTPFLQQFQSIHPGATISTGPGRFLLYMADGAPFFPGTLPYTFKQYGGDINPTALDPVNSGVVFSTPSPTVTLSAANGVSKPYDGGTFVALDNVGLGVSGGVLAGDVVAPAAAPSSLFGFFADKDAGTAKPITVASGAFTATDTAGHTVLGYLFSTLPGDITPRPLFIGTGATVPDKVYDGSLAGVVNGFFVSGLVNNETLVVTPSASFDDPNVGSAKPVTVTAALADGAGGLASNYTLAAPLATSASITPRPLTLTGVSAANKVYDGSSAAVVSAGLNGLVLGEALTVDASGSFSDPNVGTGKPVGVSVSLADGDGGLVANYTLATATAATSASITPATLSYHATPVSTFVGLPLPALGGSVIGFVGVDTQASATTGLLAFSTIASATSLPGLYPVLGSGLAAANYVFIQDPGNSQALTVQAWQTHGDARVALAAGTDAVAPQQSTSPPVPAVTARAPVLDVTQATRTRAPRPGVSFQPLPLASMKPGTVSRVLQAREDFKREVFAGALAELAANPSLADLPACQSPEQLQTGRCLLTESLKRQVQASSGDAMPSAASQAQVATPATEPAIAPALTPAPVPSPSSAPIPTPAPAADAPAASPRPPATAARAVRNASLPQIRRKLALVVGVDRYGDTRIPQLETPVHDAQAIARTLEDNLGYETVVLADPGKEALVAALNRLALQAQPQDSVIVYYAGHGELVPSTRLGYWQLSNARADDARGWLSNADIAKLLGLVGASQVALISDSCYSGSLVAGERIRPSADGDAAPLLSRKAAVAMSSGGNEPVADEGRDGHSPFAWNLMQQLGALPAWQPGGNVFERVRYAVAKELPQRPQYGAAPQGGHQSGADYLFERRELAR